jgi:DNA-binding transcriptional MocR family regulator
MADWVPSLPLSGGPRYRAIVEALEAAIRAGDVRPGARLLPHRDMAERLDLSVGTVSKAYAEAEQRGLIAGAIGRGTFVTEAATRGRESGASPIDLALNVPPATGETALIAATLAAILADDALPELLGYLPHAGRRDHRAALAAWLALQNAPVHPDQLFVTHGAQHGVAVALSLVARAGDVVLAEDRTYSGLIALGEQAGYRLHGVAMDAGGLDPDALDRAFAETGAKVLYCMPTLQTPSATTMSADRRRRVADVVRRHDAHVVEDDAYGFLLPDPPPPVSQLIPERAFYAVSLAKCLSAGLRVGALVAPERFRDPCINALRATGWMAVPLMAELVSRLIRGGDLARQAKLKRAQAETRNEVAAKVLGRWLAPVATPGFHVWLPLPAGRPLTGFIAEAAQGGVKLALPAALRPLSSLDIGVRLCLGAPPTATSLEAGLQKLRAILETSEVFSVV